MYPEPFIDEYSRARGKVGEPVSPPERTWKGVHHLHPLVRDAYSASTTAGPPLRLETESTRRAREARARAKRSETQDGTCEQVWSNVPEARGARREGALPLQAQDRSRTIGGLKLRDDSNRSFARHDSRVAFARVESPLSLARDAGSGADATMCNSSLKIAHGEGREAQARRALEAARDAEASGYWREALWYYTVAVENGANDAENYFRLGLLLRRTNGDLRRSLAHLRRATLLRPQNVQYRRELAKLYHELGLPINARRQRARLRQLEEVAPPKRFWRFW